MSDISRRLSDEMEKCMTAALYGTSTVAAAPVEPLTLDMIQKMTAALPPRETWLSSRLFPDDKAISVSSPGEKFTCAGPGFWARVEDALRKSAELKPVANDDNGLGVNLRPLEIDPWDGDSEDRAKWRAEHWDRLRDAFEVAMTPLPEWLRSPPKFGKHQ